MTDIERLLAIEEIKNLKARYFRCMDTKDWAGFQAVFAPDATVDFTREGGDPTRSSATGAANVTKLIKDLVAPALTIHHGHMPEIELTSATTARGIWAMEDLIWWPEGSRRKTLHGFGHYHETYEKIDGRWLIKTLRLTRLRVDQT
jgi:SnoaL-like protein